METKTVDELFDGILDTSLDDIEDLPEFVDFIPTGSYTLKIVEAVYEAVEMEVEDEDTKLKKKIQAPVIRVQYEIRAIGELKDITEAHMIKVAEGDQPGNRFSESFFFHKDKKKQKEIFKAKYKEIAAKFATTDIAATLAVMKDLEITALIKSTKSKKDPDRYFMNTSNIQPL